MYQPYFVTSHLFNKYYITSQCTRGNNFICITNIEHHTYTRGNNFVTSHLFNKYYITSQCTRGNNFICIRLGLCVCACQGVVCVVGGMGDAMCWGGGVTV